MVANDRQHARIPTGQRITGSDGAVVPARWSISLRRRHDIAAHGVFRQRGYRVRSASVTCDAGGYPSNSGSRVLIWTGDRIIQDRLQGCGRGDAVDTTPLAAIDTNGFLTTPSTSIDWRTTSVRRQRHGRRPMSRTRCSRSRRAARNVVCTLPDAALADGLEFEFYHNSTSGTVTCPRTRISHGQDDRHWRRSKALPMINRGDSVRLKSNGVDYIATSYGTHSATRVWVVESPITSPPGSPTVGAAYLIVGTRAAGLRPQHRHALTVTWWSMMVSPTGRYSGLAPIAGGWPNDKGHQRYSSIGQAHGRTLPPLTACAGDRDCHAGQKWKRQATPRFAVTAAGRNIIPGMVKARWVFFRRWQRC